MGQTSMLMAVVAVILGGLTGSAGSAFTVAVRGGKPDCPIVQPASPKSSRPIWSCWPWVSSSQTTPNIPKEYSSQAMPLLEPAL